MADRARMAKIPQPEAALKCPRCDSTNTKFCYFNNYSLTQPRHFCKTCRRYWTRGGALRSVPVGGGCRRNKKTKSSSSGNSNRSKSPAATSSGEPKQGGGGGGPSGVISPTGSNGGEMIGHFSQNPHHHSFMASIQNLARFGGGNGGGALGLSFGEIQGVPGHDHHGGGGGGLGFQIGSGGDQILAGEQHHSADQWRLQQHFPLMGGSEFEAAAASATANLYPFHQSGGDGNAMVGMMTSSGSRASQFPPVKLEGRPGLNLMSSPSSSRPPSMGVSENSGQFWAGNGGGGAASWTDLSGLNSASTSHLL